MKNNKFFIFVIFFFISFSLHFYFLYNYKEYILWKISYTPNYEKSDFNFNYSVLKKHLVNSTPNYKYYDKSIHHLVYSLNENRFEIVSSKIKIEKIKKIIQEILQNANDNIIREDLDYYPSSQILSPNIHIKLQSKLKNQLSLKKINYTLRITKKTNREMIIYIILNFIASFLLLIFLRPLKKYFKIKFKL